MHIVGRWCYTPYTEAKETLDAVPVYPVFLCCNICCLYPSPGVFLLFPRHVYLPSSSPATSTVSLAPVRSMPVYSNHRIPTRSHGVLSVSSHRSRIDRVAMNCATMLCLRQMYSPIASNPASFLTAADDVGSHFPSGCCHRYLPVGLCSTWSWKPPSTRPIQEVTTQVSGPKMSTDCTKSLKKNPNTYGVTPSLLIILINIRHTTRTFARFLTAAVQSSSPAEITRQWTSISADVPGCDRPLLLRCQNLSLLLLPLLLLRGAPMHPLQIPP